MYVTHVCDKFSHLTESMSKRFSNLWLLGKADVVLVDAFLWHEDLNVIQFNLIKGTGLVVDALFPLFRAARGPGM